MPPKIKHLFVLMLENRSFDHLFGRSGIAGVDAETGAATQIDGLPGAPAGAPFMMPIDPHHEFENVYLQLTGQTLNKPDDFKPPYPPITLGGFEQSFVASGGTPPDLIRHCFDTPNDLPVLYALAQEFAICDRWFASLPGPTWPNRMFVHAASSGGLDHSPTTPEIVEWEGPSGFPFPFGNIFQVLKAKKVPYHLYSGDAFPMVSALKGIGLLDVHRIPALQNDLAKGKAYPYAYTFIEPSYDIPGNYRGGSSMHPCGDVRAAEALVKVVYEAIRGSDVWEQSMLVIAWDEHGGFYDHVKPPPAVAPGDTQPRKGYNTWGFTFEQYGVRVPAIVVSPWVARNTIDHRLYDHASIPRTIADLLELNTLTERDAEANGLLPLLTLDAPRQDTPPALPDPVNIAPAERVAANTVDDPQAPVNGFLPAVLHAAMSLDMQLNPSSKDQIMKTVAGITTRDDAAKYIASVEAKLPKT